MNISRAKPKILIVEDERIVAGDIQNILVYLGYIVPAIVSSGKKAIEEAEKSSPDLILMDIHLRGNIDGIEAASQILSRFDIPIVYISAMSDEATLQRAGKTEPFGFIHKPIEEKDLFTTIEMVLFRHKMERRLKESEEKYRALFNNVPIGVYRTTPDGKILDANDALIKILGFDSFEELSKRNLQKEGFGQGHSRSTFRKLLEHDSILKGFESSCLKKDNSTIFIRESAVAIWGKNGDVMYYMGTVEDITGHKKAEEEKEKLLVQIIQSEKMSGLTTLAGGIAHEFNNLIQIISGHAQYAKKAKKSEDIIESLNTVIATSNRASGIVRNLLALSRPKVGKKELCHITDPLEEVLSLIEKRFKLQNVRVIKRFKETPMLLVNKGEVQQLFLNMIVNALDSMSNRGGKLKIDIYQSNGNIEIKFSDTGKGIKKEDLGKVFEPFYTTKDTVGGDRGLKHTGLGLSIAYGIIKRHKGTIEVTSDVNRGTTFTISLPVKV